jgi:hypothetical protein
MEKRKSRKGKAGHGDRVYDMRHLYGRLPTNAHIVATTIDEPNGLLSREKAELEAAQHRDGTVGEGAPEWVPPTRPQIIVAQSIRNDPLGQMYARHQVDRPEYLAARNYQELYAVAQVGNIGAMNPCKPYVDGGTFSDFVTEKQRLAAKRIRAVDHAVTARCVNPFPPPAIQHACQPNKRSALASRLSAVAPASDGTRELT